MTALSDLLTQSNVNGWSTREIARQAEKKEHQLAQPTVSKYMGGRHGIPTEPVLEAFSDVLNIPIDKLREAAGVPTGADAPWAPPAEANRLDRRQRRALEELIRSMVTSEATGEDRTDDDQDSARVVRDAQPDGITPSAGEHPMPSDRMPIDPSLTGSGRYRWSSDMPADELYPLVGELAAQRDDQGAPQPLRQQAGEILEALLCHLAKQHAQSPTRTIDTNPDRSDADQNVDPLQRGSSNDRPWEQDQYGLAAKRGRNRGREARQQQDRDAEDGGA